MDHILRQQARQIIEHALEEDLGGGDLTTQAILPKSFPAQAILLAREDLVLAGLDGIALCFQVLDPTIQCKVLASDGNSRSKDTSIVEIMGDGRGILAGERTALNFLQKLSGIATLTARYVAAVAPYSAKIVDTRKTTPGWRALEKYAVRMGGGSNHRFNLNSGILIKDNHIDLAGSLSKAVQRARDFSPHPLKIEVETRNLDEVQEALSEKVDIILLDNFSTEEMKKALQMIKGKTLTEASGGITLNRVKEVAATGVDFISVGALTHSATAVDICLNIQK